jgi:hypothetical protein
MPYGIPCRRGSSPSALRRRCIGSQLVEALAALTIELHNRAISDAIRCARTRDIQWLYPRHAARSITLGLPPDKAYIFDAPHNRARSGGAIGSQCARASAVTSQRAVRGCPHSHLRSHMHETALSRSRICLGAHSRRRTHARASAFQSLACARRAASHDASRKLLPCCVLHVACGMLHAALRVACHVSRTHVACAAPPNRLSPAPLQPRTPQSARGNHSPRPSERSPPCITKTATARSDG